MIVLNQERGRIYATSSHGLLEPYNYSLSNTPLCLQPAEDSRPYR